MEWTSSFRFWEIVLDLTGIFFCCLTVIHLIRQKQMVLSVNVGEELQNIPNSLSKLSVAPASAVPPFDTVYDNVLEYPDGIPARESKRRKTDPYEEARRLADLGMSIKGISERVKIPQCEIELIIDINRIRASYAPGQKMAHAV
ncbi:MAG: hypothetical protein WA151_16855 [Desulfatirhabdiaceae bacterium]